VTASLVTRGMIGGSSSDSTDPVISNMTPTPGVAPGDPGGFSADYATAKWTPIEFDLTDVMPGLATFSIWCELPGEDDVLLVHDGANFRGRWAARSSIVAIANGYHLSVLPSRGWPPGEIPDFTVRAVDAAGNVEGP
jgi:hypothetical protein